MDKNDKGCSWSFFLKMIEHVLNDFAYMHSSMPQIAALQHPGKNILFFSVKLP